MGGFPVLKGPEYDAADLASRFEVYKKWRAAQEPVAEAARWRSVIDLDALLQQPAFCRIRLGGRDGALYERMYKSNPDRFASRALFLVAMRKVFGFELAPSRGPVDLSVKRLVDRLFEAFDDTKSDSVDWRVVLLMLHVAREPWLAPIEHLRWGFALLGAEGTLDETLSDPFHGRIRDVKDLMCALFAFERRPELLEVVDETWFAVTAGDRLAFRLTRRAGMQRLLAGAPALTKKRSMYNNGATAVDDIKLSKSLFEKLLATDPLNRLLTTTSEAFGALDSAPWTYVIEEQFYHPVAKSLTRERRRERHIESKAAAFASKHRCRTRWRFAAWRDLARYARWQKKRLREQFLTVIFKRQQLGFEGWVEGALITVRVVDIQRTLRGMMGRNDALWARRVRLFIVKVQSGIRGFLQRVQFAYRHEREYWAATEIQRHTRSLCAKRFVSYRLEAHVDRERRILAQRIRDWEMRCLVAAALAVQNAYRARLARVKREEERQRQIAVAIAVGAMEAHAKENERKRRIYEMLLTEWYNDQREQAQRDLLFDDFSNAEKAKILHYRRREAYRQQALKRKREAELAQMLEDQRVSEWLAAWENVKKERVEALKKHLEQCRKKPETKEERAVQKHLRREVTKRVKDVLRRAKEADNLMELPEARDFAFKEVVLKKCQDEEDNVDLERKEAAEAYYAAQQAKAQLEADAADRELDRRKEWAAGRIQNRWALYVARRDLRRLCTSAFTKEFDVDLRQAYYLNKVSGESQWRKPYGLGDYDIRLKDRWYVLRDETNVPYYYNPATLLMSWDVPEGTILCGDCRQRFCNVHSTERDAFLCTGCLVAHQQSLEAAAMATRDSTDEAPDESPMPDAAMTPVKRVDGAETTAADVDLESRRAQQVDTVALLTEGRLVFIDDDLTSMVSSHATTTRQSDETTMLKHSKSTRSLSTRSVDVTQTDDDDGTVVTLLERAQEATEQFLADSAERAASIQERRRAEEPIHA